MTMLMDGSTRREIREPSVSGVHGADGSAAGVRPYPDAPTGEIAPQVALKQFSDAPKGRPTGDVVVRLNDHWAIMLDSRQWVLAERRGQEWRPQKFCYERDHMLEIIDKICGNVRPEALAEIGNWPERHATWYRLRTGRPTSSIALAARDLAGRHLAPRPPVAPAQAETVPLAAE